MFLGFRGRTSMINSVVRGESQSSKKILGNQCANTQIEIGFTQ